MKAHLKHLAMIMLMLACPVLAQPELPLEQKGTVVTEYRFTDQDAELLAGEPGVDIVWEMIDRGTRRPHYRVAGAMLRIPETPPVALSPKAARRLQILIGYTPQAFQIDSEPGWKKAWVEGEGVVIGKPGLLRALNAPSKPNTPERHFRYKFVQIAQRAMATRGNGRVFHCFEDAAGDFAITLSPTPGARPLVLGSRTHLSGPAMIIEHSRKATAIYPAKPFPAGMFGELNGIDRVVGIGLEGLVLRDSQGTLRCILIRGGKSAVDVWEIDPSRVRIPQSWSVRLGSSRVEAEKLVGLAAVSPKTWFDRMGLAFDPEVLFEEWMIR